MGMCLHPWGAQHLAIAQTDVMNPDMPTPTAVAHEGLYRFATRLSYTSCLLFHTISKLL